MREQTAFQVLVPREMTPDDRRQLIDDLYRVRRRIFDGPQRTRSFASHVIESDREQGCVVLHRRAGDEIAAYFAMQIFEIGPRGAEVAIFRGEFGALADGEFGDLVLRFVLARLLRYMLAHPARPVYGLCSLAHPSSYALFARFADIARTGPADKDGPGADVLLSELAAALERDPDGGGPFVFEAGQRALDAARACDFLHLYEKPAVRFFLSARTGPSGADGLVTLVPLSLGGMMRAAAQRTSARVNHP